MSVPTTAEATPHTPVAEPFEDDSAQIVTSASFVTAVPWEEHLDKPLPSESRFPRCKIYATAALCISFIAYGANFNLLGPTLSMIAERTNTDIQSLGYLFTIRGLGAVVGVMIGGRLLDRFGTVLARKVMIISTIILVAASLVGSSISPYYALTLTLNGVAGFCSGFINVFCNSLMGFLWGDRVGTFMQLLHFCFGVGSVAAPLIATAAYSAMNGVMNRIMWDTLSVSYYIVAFLWIIPIILYAIVPEMDAQKSQTEDQNEIVNIKTVPKVEEVRSPLQRIREKLTRTFIMHTLGCLLISAALFFYSEGIFAGLMFTYLTSRELTDDTGAGLINSLFWLTFTIGRLLAIPISAKVKPSIMVILDLIGSSIALITMIVFSNNLTIFTIATGLLGISFASQFPATMSLPASHMGVELTGALTSIIMLGSSFGGMIMPLAITYSFSIAGTLGFLYGIIIMIAISASCYITLLVFFRKQKIYIPVKPVEPLVDIIVKVEKPQITV